MLVRKTVTVIFCDLTGSTQLGERNDPEVMRSVLSRYFDEMRTVVERHGGTVEKFIGDAVMAVFGVPSVHEDDAYRAVRAAAEMRARLGALTAELEREQGVRIQARIGVNTGSVVAGDDGGGDALVTGDVVVVAKRFEECAEPGEILIGELTRRLVADGVELGADRLLTLKGKAERVRAWPLVRVLSESAPRLGRFDAPLVGRADALAQVRAAYELAATTREFQLVTVLGPPGIGKSRLARELCRAVAPEARAVAGRCLAYGDGITFWPIAEIVRSAGGLDAIDAALADAPDAERVAEKLRGVVGATRTAGSSEEAFWAVRRYLEALAGDRPLVACIDDVHWGERTLLELIDYLHGWTRDAPILLLVLARPELLERQRDWATPRPRAELVVLDPLSSDEATTLLDELGDELGLSPTTRARVAEAAEGNPLFLEQFAAMLAEADGEQEVSVPPSIEALISARLDRLSADERSVVDRAAVIGREFALAAVSDLAPDELRSSVQTHLLAMTRSGLVEPHVSPLVGGDAFRFRHGLIREVAYDRVAKELRAELHRRFAAWLERAARERMTEIEEIVGYHLEQAFRLREQLGRVDDDVRAVAVRAGELLGSAGGRAFDRGDMPAALNLLDRALALLTDEHPAYLELLQETSSALWVVGEIARAETLLNALLEAASARGDVRYEWSARLERAGRRHITDPDARSEDLLEVTEEAVRVFEELGDDRELARAWRRLSLVPRARGHYAISTDAVERALSHARRANERQEQMRLMSYLCTLLVFGPIHVDEAVPRFDRLIAEAEGTPLVEAAILASYGVLEAMRGRFEVARTLVERSESVYTDLGLHLTIVGWTELAGYVEFLAGDPRAAESVLRRGYDFLAATGRRPLLVFPACLLAEALFAQGRSTEATALLDFDDADVPHDDAETNVRWREAKAKASLAVNRFAEAEQLAREAVARAEATDALTLQGDALVRLAEVLRARGRDHEWRDALQAGIDCYTRKGNVASARLAGPLEQPPRRVLARETRTP